MSGAARLKGILAGGTLIGLGVGGWFLGNEGLAHDAAPPPPVIVTTSVEVAPGASGSLVIPRSGLSPFGHHGGLLGWQLLVGRVTSVETDSIHAATAAGDVTIALHGSPFLLRLVSAGADAIEPGAAIAIVLRAGTPESAVTAESALVLPVSIRPMTTVIAERSDGEGS